jgi:cytochrome c biogenesis protein
LGRGSTPFFFREHPLPSKEEKGFWPTLRDFLSSLQLTIALLIILAASSIFGTVIPQNGSPEEYLRIYKVSTYKILKILGFLDLYHSGWFLSLLVLLSFNLIFCSWRRFRITWKFFSAPVKSGEEWKTWPFSKKIYQEDLPSENLLRVQKVLTRFFSAPKTFGGPSGALFAEKGKFSRLGVYFIHLSVLLILGGALIGSLWGFRGEVNILEGQTTDRVVLPRENQNRLLEFALKLDQFDVSFYPTGPPKEFKSTVTILERGQKVLTDSIRVNHPLTYQGISFYQSSYSIAGLASATLRIKDRETGREMDVPVQIGARTEIPGGAASFLLTQLIPDFQGMGPALQGLLFHSQSRHENLFILQNHPEWETQRPGRYQFTIKEMKPRYRSILQANRDPGVWVVWVGCFMMCGGFYMAFYLSHRRVWVRLSQEGQGTKVEITGSSHRDRPGFEREFEKICQALQSQNRLGKA